MKLTRREIHNARLRRSETDAVKKFPSHEIRRHENSTPQIALGVTIQLAEPSTPIALPFGCAHRA